MRCGWAMMSPARARAGLALMLSAALLAVGCGRGTTADELERNARAAEVFLTANARAEGVRTLDSGLQYKVVQSGPGGSPSPDSNDLVRVHYEGALTDGTVFDSSLAKGQPFVTTPEQVVPGWTEALQLMKVGDEWMLYVPPALGYGERRAGDIPPNSVLVFRIILLDVAPTPGGRRGVGIAAG